MTHTSHIRGAAVAALTDFALAANSVASGAAGAAVRFWCPQSCRNPAPPVVLRLAPIAAPLAAAAAAAASVAARLGGLEERRQRAVGSAAPGGAGSTGTTTARCAGKGSKGESPQGGRPLRS
eukprot:CAMPEP_0175789432 /NCGR_PEP_ID=MMETSP0097-20121207/81396_1 /TAXON_ID=311494 /ORGANISM="Alexandrium monilatum, Strain CCMP3105" /LENGTH=121 /DNA_ID=CAMNT_0017100485 /DNA_START=219 /DNA_END=581 /DNA_ORIENTATION=-